mgnify:CR=1 FL=1
MWSESQRSESHRPFSTDYRGTNAEHENSSGSSFDRILAMMMNRKGVFSEKPYRPHISTLLILNWISNLRAQWRVYFAILEPLLDNLRL